MGRGNGSTSSPLKGSTLSTRPRQHPRRNRNTLKSQPTKNYRQFAFSGAVCTSVHAELKIGKEPLDDGNSNRVGVLSLSLSLFPVAPVRNVTKTRRVSELRWSVAPNLSRPHFTGNENTKRDNATCLRTSIFTPRFSSTVVDLPFSRHRLVVSSSTFFFFPIFFFLFPSFFFFFFFFFLYINLVTLLFLAATRSLNPSPRFF